MTTPADIDAMLARIALGDRKAFAALYAATSSKLFAICLRILINRPEAEDALQEVYVKIWNRAGSYAAGTASPMSWLTQIARNQAIDIVRQRRGNHVDLDQALELADDAPLAETTLARKSEVQALDHCLQQLEAERAEAVRKAYLDGWSYQDLAERFDVPLNTMRTWLRRSLLKLKACLGGDAGA
jgi:RNA polymerase sigma-70 factor, ECF subfamily